MTFSAWMLLLAVFLSGAVAGVFAMLVIGVHMSDRARHLTDEPSTHVDAITRSVLGVGRRTGPHNGAERELPMHALNRSDYPMPVITENHLRRSMMPCLLLALPNPVLPFMAGVPNAGKATADRPRWSTSGRDHSGIWLRNAAAGLCLLAAAAAVVSFTAQYRLIQATRRLAVVAALEASIPDAAALVFACLGIALALHGRRALRPRALNLASVGASVFMNAIAAAPGWRNLAIWAMPPIAYALASDTLVAVVRAWALARHQHLDVALAADRATPLAILGGLILWLLRLAPAPASTLAGFRAWVLAECPVAPGRRAPSAPEPPVVPSPRLARVPRQTKTARFLSLVTERHGPLASIPLDRVAQISAHLAPAADLNPGAARTALRKAVLAARNGENR
jgi:hypothetical protein